MSRYLKENKVLFLVGIVAIVSLLFYFNMRKEAFAGDVTFGVVINYEDGTSKVVDGTKTTLSFLPMTIVDSTGKAFESVAFTIKVKYDWDPVSLTSVSDLDWTGSSAKITLDGVTKKSVTLNFPSSVSNDTWHTLASVTLTSSTLSTWTSPRSTEYALKCMATIRLEMSPPGYVDQGTLKSGVATLYFLNEVAEDPDTGPETMNTAVSVSITKT